MVKNDQLAELVARAEGPLLFWGRSLQNFGQICSLFPSSPFVGRAMSWAIADRPAGHVIELGAGTGAVTRQLINSGIPAGELSLLEIDPKLGGHLRRTFPDLDVIIAPAQDLATLWRDRNGPSVGAVVSTLPMRLFSKKAVLAIMRASLSVLEPGGVFVQSPTGRAARCRNGSARGCGFRASDIAASGSIFHPPASGSTASGSREPRRFAAAYRAGL
jgi:phospholipid N-methyltransferase